MANKRLKKLTALLLSIVMVFSMVTEAFPAAFAAEEAGGSTPQADTPNYDFSNSTKTRRPGLYVDFLGDNSIYQAPAGERDTVLGGASSVLNGLVAPGTIDQSSKTNKKDAASNPDGTDNTWAGYHDTDPVYNGNTVFWVGVGISRMNLLDLFKQQDNQDNQDNGIYGLELGFYYDSRYIEPYTGATANDNSAYRAIIEAANLTNYASYQWEGYRIVDAQTNLKPQTDPVTQEVIQNPDMDEIMGRKLPTHNPDGLVDSPWRMTYVSIEKTNVVTDNRFKDSYGTTKPTGEDLDTQYLLLIPFKLKKYDTQWQDRVCLRLTRSAGLLSIGGGEGDTPYTAWERVTTRNPGRELKLMTDFQGDLNIFSGERYLEKSYKAHLIIEKAGGDDNTAQLSIRNDPSPNPVTIDQSGQVIEGLYGGTGMEVKVHVATGYKATVEVYYSSTELTETNKVRTYIIDPQVLDAAVKNEGEYVFVMPEADATVRVTFEVTNAAEFRLYLDEKEQYEDWTDVPDGIDTGIRGNSTVLTATHTDNTTTPGTPIITTVKVDKDSPDDNSLNLPAEMVRYSSEVRADIKVHGDYEAVVWFTNAAVPPTTEYDIDAAVGTVGNVDGKKIVLPQGGTVILRSNMPESDVVVHVTYRPAVKRNVILEVHHKDITPSQNNVAQLATTVYTKENIPQAAYSGVVYEDDAVATEPDRYRQVENTFRVLDRVDLSSAAGSGSLGGDGRAPMAWSVSEDSLMALLAKAATADDLKSVKPLDLRWDTAPGSSTPTAALPKQPENGIRKNTLGERYTDRDITDFYTRLLELKGLADAAIAAEAGGGAASPAHLVEVKDPNDSTKTLYSYYDLSWQQVQAYILDYEARKTYEAAKDQYDKDKAQYDLDKAAYDKYLDDKANETAANPYTGPVVREPKLPMAPIEVEQPALRDQAGAEALLNDKAAMNGGKLWYEPSETSDPPTAVNSYKLQVRPGRKMAVVLEAGSTYTVAKSIVIRPAVDDGAGNLVASTDRTRDIVLDDISGKLVRSTEYQNEFLFDMPDYDCIVEVTYTERKAHTLELQVIGDYDKSTPPVSKNNVTVTGYGPNNTAGSITAAAITPLTTDKETAEVLEDSTVSILVHVDTANYDVQVHVGYDDTSGGSSNVATVPNVSGVTSVADGTVITFKMPAVRDGGKARVVVTYTSKKPLLDAHLRLIGDTGSSSGYWEGTTLLDTTAHAGDALKADINVAPGYYIYAVEAHTATGAYPFTVSGNGWNNGQGGKVTIDTVMPDIVLPDKDYWVYVEFRQGPPEPEPGLFLTLRVNDPDNEGPTFANNWARAEVYRGSGSTPVVTLGPLRKTSTTVAEGIAQRDHAEAGDLVRVTFAPESDAYVVESVEIQPVGIGTSPIRTSGNGGNEVEFTMPAASAAVVVTFRKKENAAKDPLYLHLNKTENGTQITDNSSGRQNHLNSVVSPTIDATGSGGHGGSVTVPSTLPAILPTGSSGDTGIAKPGELVELRMDVAPGWYIHSLTVSGDQGRVSYDLWQTYVGAGDPGNVKYDPKTHYNAAGTGTAINVVGTFVMPDSDVHVTVNYRQGPDDPGKNPDPDPSEHEVELVVEDPENATAPYADNRASAVVSGIGADRNITAVGKGTTGAGVLRRVAAARAGEEVTIDYAADTGYALEIILVTPAGLHVPVNYLESGKARFTMPDSSVTAIVRFKKEPAIQYTANLVLHFPANTAYRDYDKIGEGSFRTGTTGLDRPNLYPDGTKLYSQLALPGDRLDFDLLAHDGYYIETVTVGPEELGVPAPYTGSFGRQNGYVIMPAANIQINVYFKAGWPDDVKPDPDTVNYDLTLEVYDAAGSRAAGGSSARFESIAGSTLSTPNNDPVYGGERRTITPRQAYDEDMVVVKLDPASGCYAQSITVTDSRGRSVPWQYAPGGIAFEMVPAHVTVTVKYAKLPENIDPNAPDYYHTVTLHVNSAKGTGDVTAMGTVDLTGPSAGQQAQHDGESFKVIVPPQGQTMTLVVTPNPGFHVVAAYAVDGNGETLPLATAAVGGGTMITRGMPQVSGGGTVTFAMPDGDADVYVVFAESSDPDTPGPDITRGDLPATLTVVGPNGSGSAVMGGNVETAGTPPVVTAVTTGTVTATGAKSLFAPQGTKLTVNLTVTQGFGIKAVRVVDIYGQETPYTWTNNDQRQFTLTMPAGGVHVYVELEKVVSRDDPDPKPEDQLIAQVVVNNGGNAGNTAQLRYDPTDGSAGLTGALLSPLYAGDRIHLDLTVQPGFRVEYVKVVPAKYGLLPRIDVEDPSFLMPGEDVVVYVKFADDERDRRNVTLKAVSDNLEDTNDPIQDMATIENEDTKVRGDVVHPVTKPNSTQIQAGPANATQDAEWVVVDYGWAAEHAIKSLTVKDQSGSPVPFTQVINDQTNRKGQIKFPMVDSDVTVTIEWGAKDELPKFDAVLHVIDLDDPDNTTGPSWGKLTWTDAAGTADYDHTSDVLANGEETLRVPAGEIVRVDAQALAKDGVTYYIQAAYVLFRAQGQMISFQSSGTPGAPATGVLDRFVMHPGRNDVYVYVTSHKPVDPYSAVLMLDSPAEDTTSTATMTNTSNTDDPSDPGRVKTTTVVANTPVNGHGYVTAGENDTITVTVTPAPDYSIESILMTPLGTSSDQGGPVVITKTGNTYTFTMPAHNVAVRIKLKKGEAKEYKATLHYKRVVFEEGQPPKIEDINDGFQTDWAYGDFTGMTTTPWRVDGEVRDVPEGTSVTVGASITAPSVGAQADYVLAAYVLNEKGVLVPFGPALEGLTEKDTTPDPANTDGEGSFDMPGEDIHIYVWFTNKKPVDEWYTAVLTVVDSDPNAADPLDQVNSGLNSATISSGVNNTTPIEVWSSGVTGNAKRPERLYHKFIWVTKGETVTVKTAHIEDGYSYVNTTASNSISTGGPTLTGPATDMNHTASYEVGECNTAVVVEYKASPVTRNPLNVVLIDRDNPGDGVTRNSAKVSPTGMTELDIASVTAAGARQRIPGVQSGIPVKYTATPYAGYTYVARLKDSTGKDITPSDWTMNAPGTFTMPGGETTLEITYFKAREATLVVQDTRGTMTGSDISRADMAEDAFGGTVTAGSDGTKGIFVALPKGTTLAATAPTMPTGVRLIGVIVTDSGGSRLLAPNAGDGMYRYTIGDSDVEIRMIVGPDTAPQPFIASVSAVNLPARTAEPTIAVTTPTANPTHGDNWTVADKDDTVTVTVKVPEDYEATLIADNGTALSVPTMTADGTATFAMPADNTHVTVTYRKIAFQARIIVTPAAGGGADLTEGATIVTANTPVDTLYHLAAGTSLTYTATPNTGYTLTRVLMTTASGAAWLLTGGTAVMPDSDVTITVFFDDDNDSHHIAYVTTVDTDSLPANAAQNIKNESSSALDTPFGTLYTYGDDGHSILVNFTTEPDYWADVTAEYTDGTGTHAVFVNQQGITGACTARITMPDADVEVKITYHKKDVDAPPKNDLTLRLVGHGQESENQATLKYTQTDGSTGTLSLVGSSATDTLPYYSGSVSVQAGAALDLDAWRKSDYVFDRMTVAVWNGDPTDPIIYNEIDLSWADYLLNGVSLFAMPNAKTLVTVYYRQPYQVTLFVIDAEGDDYNDGQATPGPEDTAVTPHDRVPKVTMSVDNAAITTNNPTTKTHTPIKDLNGKEKVTTQVDTKEVANGGTMPDNVEIASVIVTTPSGTTHLTETVGKTGEYLYMMSDSTSTPVRRAANADITVILRDKNDPRMYTATVYKVGHDDKRGNTATIKDVNEPMMPFKGEIWTGAYPGDQLQVDVTTEPGYYAVVTAKTVGGIDLAVLQYDTQGTMADPIKAILYMPDGTPADLTDIDPDDVDVTVTYTTKKPQSKLWLLLEGHDDNEENQGTVNQVTTNPDTTETLTQLLSAPKPDPADSTKYVFQDGPATADSGIDLRAQGTPDDGYTVEKIELVVTVGASTITQTLTMDAQNRANTKLPVGDNVKIVITFKAGKRTPKPFDPWHSEKYVASLTGTTGYTDYASGTTTGDNPDLSDATKDGTDGWILGESTGEALTILVPTLFEGKTYDDEKADTTTPGDVKKALSDAGVDTAATDHGLPPVYKLYWQDDSGKYQELKADVDMTVTSQDSVLAANNPHGMTHIGYQLVTIVPKKDDTTGKLTANGEKLAEYISNGGTLFITATGQRDELEDGATTPTRKYDLESYYTQVVISSARVRPYDPDRENPAGTTDPTYEDHWIRAENRGDYLIVTVPMLNTKSGDTPTGVDGTTHRLQLHLQLDGTDRDDISTIVNVTDYLNIQNVRDYENFWNVNLEYDPDWRTAAGYAPYLFDPFYENGVYYTGAADPGPDNIPGTADDIPYTGAKFVVSIKDPTSTDPLVEALKKIFDNEGTMNGTASNYRMYITSDEVDALGDPLPTFRKDDYTDFEVPRYYSLAGDLQSWAPNHVAELTLYREDPAAAGTYLKDPWLKIRSGLSESMLTTSYDPAIYNGHWSMEFAFKSSELVAEDGTALTYQMVVEKVSHLTYTHTEIKLDTGMAAPIYDPAKLIFAFENPIYLFCGDIAPTLPGPNQLINDQDRNLLAGFNYGVYTWNDSQDDTNLTDWSNSTYNPDSYAYMADLNGDGIISEQDLAILMSEFNWMRDSWDYGAPKGLTFGSSGIMLLMEELLTEEAAAEEPEEGEETVEGTGPEEGEETAEGTDPEAPEETPESPNGSENPDETDHAEDPDNTETPEEPTPPVEPKEAGDTDMPEEPTEPEGDTEPEIPAEPKDPDTTDTPETPEEPSDPPLPEPETEPDQPPLETDMPFEPEDPATSEESGDSNLPATPEESVPVPSNTEGADGSYMC